MLTDSDLNFHKKLMRFEYSQLYFHDSKFSHEIHKNIVPRKFRTIRYIIPKASDCVINHFLQMNVLQSDL